MQCVPYDAALVRVVRDGIQPRAARGLCGPQGRKILDNLRTEVLLSNDQLAEVPPENLAAPYFDPALRSDDARRAPRAPEAAQGGEEELVQRHIGHERAL